METRNPSAPLFLTAFVVLSCGAQVAFSDTAPCALLAQNQVSTTIEASVGAGSPIANTGCSWHTTGAKSVTVTVSLQSEKMFAGAKSSAAPGMTNTPISGIGDEAIFTGVPNFSSLWVKKGSKVLLVRIYGLAVSEAQPKLKALATIAVSKL